MRANIRTGRNKKASGLRRNKPSPPDRCNLPDRLSQMDFRLMRWNEETPGMAKSLIPKNNPRGVQPVSGPILSGLPTQSPNLQGKSAPPNEQAVMGRKEPQGAGKAR